LAMINKVLTMSNIITNQKFFYIQHQLGDLDFIINCLESVPENRRDEVAAKYESIFIGERRGHRAKANKYIENVSKEYRKVH